MSSLHFTARYGIDGARTGWVVATATSAVPSLALVPELSALTDRLAEGGALIDIPIGLPGGPHPTRSCDAAARSRLGRRSSSVFPTLSRAALGAGAWPEANELNRAATGKGLPVQSWGLVAKIREVDALLASTRRLRGRLRESHPELAFAWLNGGAPLARPKRESAGLDDRLGLLEQIWTGIGGVVGEFARAHAGVGADDVADALALLALAEAGAVPLPETPPRDEVGCPMEILAHPSVV